MLENEARVNLFLTQYCKMLVGDIADERMAEQPLPGVNHPAWILGHLAATADFASTLLGGEKTLPPQWVPLFQPGSKPTACRSDYPPKDELQRAFEQSFQQLRQKASAASTEQLSRPNTSARAKEALPTAKEMVAFLLTGHAGIHLGQLSMWRRLIGIAPLF